MFSSLRLKWRGFPLGLTMTGSVSLSDGGCRPGHTPKTPCHLYGCSRQEGSVREKLGSPCVASRGSRHSDGGAAGASACPAFDAPFLGPSGASGQQPTAFPFSPIYPGVFSQLLSLSCLRRKELNSYLSIQPSSSFLLTEQNPPFCLLVLDATCGKTYLTLS